MHPIPKKLLIHTVIHAREADNDRWEEAGLIDQQVLNRVRMEPSCKTVRDKNNAEIQLAATLFYDCKNSQPRGMEFKVDDIILFNDQKYAIQLLEPLYDGKKLHHYEMGLIRHA